MRDNMAKILVVEDNEQNRILIRQVLAFHKYNVIEASDGPTGIKMAREERPDLVLLDINMPLMDGFEMISGLRSIPECAGLKVIAVTSMAMKGDREKALAAGFDGYITKPIDTRAFPSLVQGFLKGGQV